MEPVVTPVNGTPDASGPSRRPFLGMAATVPLAATGVMTLGAGTVHAADSAYATVCFTV